MTKKVRLDLTLVGRSDNGHKVKDVEWTNEDCLDTVKSIVADYFGDKGLYIHNERSIKIGTKYPEYYAAGQFLSQPEGDESVTQLVVIAHGNSMAMAKEAMMDAVRSADWEAHAVGIS